jgi:hypothetical protein
LFCSVGLFCIWNEFWCVNHPILCCCSPIDHWCFATD